MIRLSMSFYSNSTSFYFVANDLIFFHQFDRESTTCFYKNVIAIAKIYSLGLLSARIACVEQW